MDMGLYKAGKQLLLQRQQELRSVGKLQRLPKLQTANQTAESHRRPAVRGAPAAPGDVHMQRRLGGFVLRLC